LNKTELGGRNVTKILVDKMNSSGIKIDLDDDLMHCRAIKEKMMSVLPLNSFKYHIRDLNTVILSEEKVLYKMPDETIIKVPLDARLYASEFLFE
jgi:hypothetical protein